MGVSTNPAAMRLTRTGASSSADFLSCRHRGRERRDESESLRRAAAPVPPMKSRLLPGEPCLASVTSDLQRKKQNAPQRRGVLFRGR